MTNLTFIFVHPDFFTGKPVKKASTIVVVTIRDNRAPRFTSSVYNHSLVENIGVNELVTTVMTNDPDGDDITYSIIVRFFLLYLWRLNTDLFR